MTKDNQVYLAFYKGRKTLADRIVCWVTRSPYAHCELTTCHHGDLTRYSISSSGRDGGVREKNIYFKAENWDFVLVPWAPKNTFEKAQNQLGKRYDYLGLLLSQFFNFRRGENNKWFCSELCAAALGMARPSRFSPGDLYVEVIDRNNIMKGSKNANETL